MKINFKEIFVDYIIVTLFGEDYKEIYKSYLPNMLEPLKVHHHDNVKYIYEISERNLVLVLVDDKYYDLAVKINHEFFLVKELSQQTFYFRDLMEEFLDSSFIIYCLKKYNKPKKIFEYSDKFLTNLNYNEFEHAIIVYSIFDNETKKYVHRVSKYFILEKYLESEDNITIQDIIQKIHENEREMIKEYRKKTMEILKKIK